MFNIFEQPWFFIGIAFFALVLVHVIYIFTDKGKFWQILVPTVLVLMGIGVDFLVETDREKVKSVFKTAIAAAENEDTSRIAELISADYRDTAHQSKAMLMAYCEGLLHSDIISSVTVLDYEAKLESEIAVVTFRAMVKFTDSSMFAEYGQKAMLIRMQLEMERGDDGRWLINSSEILAINNTQMGWKKIR